MPNTKIAHPLVEKMVTPGMDTAKWTQANKHFDAMSMKRSSNSRGENNHAADTYEGMFLKNWVASNQGALLYPDEKQVVSYFSQLVEAKRDDERAPVAGGNISSPNVAITHRESIDWEDVADEHYSGVNLRDVAKRVAETRKATNDGENRLVRFGDLDRDLSGLPRPMRQALFEILGLANLGSNRPRDPSRCISCVTVLRGLRSIIV